MRPARILPTLAIFLAIAHTPTPLIAGPFEDGVLAYRLGDPAAALRLWRPLAEQGHAPAQVQLGLLYTMGRAVPLDYAVAMRWFLKAAGQGNAEAQYLVGMQHWVGYGVPVNRAEALRWYEMAARRGYADAQKVLGMLFEWGEDVPRDPVQAHLWLTLAARQGDEFSIQERQVLAKSMTPTQLAEAERLARAWKPEP